MPPQPLHILQPFDVVCFLLLRCKYSHHARDLTCKRIFHINKEGFLPAFKNAFFDVFTEGNCRKVFRASGLVSLDVQVVLNCLEVQLRTPPQPPPEDPPWQSKTPSNMHERGFQSKLVSDSSTRSPVTAQAGLFQLTKGSELVLHQNTLQAARITEIGEQLAAITRRKMRKRKQIQQGDAMEYCEAAPQLAAEASIAAERSKKACGGGY
jgi:hypothetical protein